jgi:plastocyanin
LAERPIPRLGKTSLSPLSEVLLPMRRLTITLAILAATAALAACSASAPPGWTYAPAPSATPVGSGAAYGSPGASASAAPSAAPSTAPSSAPSASAGAPASPGASGGTGTALTVTAANGAATAGFDPKTLEAAANTAFTVTFDNQDTSTGPHNWVLKKPDGSKVDIGDTSFFTGPAKRTYSVPALPAGDYPFLCEVHPTVMMGTLTIK